VVFSVEVVIWRFFAGLSGSASQFTIVRSYRPVSVYRCRQIYFSYCDREKLFSILACGVETTKLAKRFQSSNQDSRIRPNTNLSEFEVETGLKVRPFNWAHSGGKKLPHIGSLQPKNPLGKPTQKSKIWTQKRPPTQADKIA
jgi:hypothetical protein